MDVQQEMQRLTALLEEANRLYYELDAPTMPDFEYDRLGLPRPDLTLYLDVPTDFTEQLLRHREQDTHTTADIHERNSAYLASCRRAGRAAAEYYGWTIISCTENGKMRSIEDIHEEIYRHVAACLED